VGGADPIATAARAYEGLGLPFDAAAERALRAHAAANPRGKHGAHHYRLADFGLDAGAVRAAFRAYTQRCGVREEALAG
jgi:hypothetical protein